jgi:hypothetical protein
MFGAIRKGDYNLTTKSHGWSLFSSVGSTTPDASYLGKQPMHVKLGVIGVCGSGFFVWECDPGYQSIAGP